MKPFSLALVVVTAPLLLATHATATVPADLCVGNPCTVTGSKTIDDGSDLDFGEQTDLVIASNATVMIGGDATITARSITLQPAARILGGDGTSLTMITTGGDIRLQAAGSSRSRIDLSANEGGSVALTASGNILLDGPISVAGSGADALGGSIALEAGGNVAVNNDLNSGAAGAFAGGGTVDIFAGGNIDITGQIITSAADSGAGDVTLGSDGGNISLTGSITANGGGPSFEGFAGSAGTIDISATVGNVVISGDITGRGGTAAFCDFGDGAVIDISAGGSVTLGGSLTAIGGSFGVGGTISVDAGLDVIQLAGSSVRADAPGSSLDCGWAIGGSFDVFDSRNTVLRNVDVGAPGGGDVSVRASGTIDILGPVDASGSFGQADGGSITLRGCSINVASGGLLDTRTAGGSAGSNLLEAGGAITIAGQVRAAASNVFRHLGIQPTITGTVLPPATIALEPSLPTCVEIALCGNGQLDGDEVCDDGNNIPCDGCNADCTAPEPVCGNGTRECAEQCDDGNLESGDGCEADCTLPPGSGLLLPGVSLNTAGCLAEWKLAIEDFAVNPTTQLPSNTQTCVDGDPRCDTDLTRDGVCTFGAQICIRVPDDRIPNCQPGPLAFLNIKQPQLPGGPNPLDQHNAQVFADALKALGGEVRSGSRVLQSGPPLTGTNVCTATMPFKVAHAPSGIGKRAFNLTTTDVNGLTMSSNLARLWCAPNGSVCGNNVQEVTEQCDDGNTTSCDGCSATCRREVCGDGIVTCGEQCDDGPLNGTPGHRCSATCSELPPELRIPGGGAKPLDCALEWSVELGSVAIDKKGIPKSQQVCKDNDPACDFDPTPGTCRFRVWVCVGGADARLGCAAAQVTRLDVRAPGPRVKRAEDIAARAALLAGLEGITLPAGPGEACSNGFAIDVPAGNRRVTLRAQATLASNKKDVDPLALRCLP